MATTTKTNKKSVKKTTKTTSKQVKVKKKTPTVAVKTEAVVEKEIKPIEVEKVVVQEQPKKPFVNKEIVEQVKKDVKKQMNIPNLLTLFRIWAIPGIVLTFFFPFTKTSSVFTVGLYWQFVLHNPKYLNNEI